ncbi:hypothetical protein BC940DRAFT_322327 [Gongronella butleri]|nr:hypothetical protein BC940DRAFT_322327 [Gongronella butleri]
MLHSIILVTDVAQWPVFRTIIFDLAWQMGFSAFSCYFFGVAHTLGASNKVIYNAWVRRPELVDAFCVTIMTIPFVLPTIFNVMSGVYATQGDTALAGFFTSVNYYIWMCFAIGLGLLVLFAGVRLITLLDDHMTSTTNHRVNIMKIKAGSAKVKLTVFFGCMTIWSLALIAGLYAAARYQITINYYYATIIAGVVNFIGPAATTTICAIILIDPSVVSAMGVWSFGTSDGSDSHPSQYINSHVHVTSLTNQQHLQHQPMDLQTMTLQKILESEVSHTEDEEMTLTPGLAYSDMDSKTQHTPLSVPSNYSLKNYTESVYSEQPASPRSPIRQQNQSALSYRDSYSMSHASVDTSFPVNAPATPRSPTLSSKNPRSPRLVPDRPTSPKIPSVEENRLQYNYAIGQLRLPTHYVSPDERRRQEQESQRQSRNRH